MGFIVFVLGNYSPCVFPRWKIAGIIGPDHIVHTVCLLAAAYFAMNTFVFFTNDNSAYHRTEEEYGADFGIKT